MRFNRGDDPHLGRVIIISALAIGVLSLVLLLGTLSSMMLWSAEQDWGANVGRSVGMGRDA